MDKRSLPQKNPSTQFSDSLLNFTLEQIKRTELPELTKKLLIGEFDDNRQNDEEGNTSSDSTSFTEISNSNTIVLEQQVPCFSVIDLDPENRVKLTPSIRGKITTFQTVQREQEERDIPHSEGTNEDEMNEIINSDLIILDVTKSQDEIIQAWNIIKDLKQILQEESEKDEAIQFNNHKTLILISSLMTWSKTNELSKEHDFKLHEVYYGLRESHEYFMPLYLLENELLKLGSTFRSKLRVLIVTTGFIYGPDEEDLTPYLKLSNKDKIELPVFGTGQNFLPVIHSVDLIRLLKTIIHNFPIKYEFIFAVEPEAITQNSLVTTLCRSFGNKAHTRMVDYKNCLLYGLKEEDVLKLSSNLPVESGYQKLVNWKNQYQFVHNMPVIARRYYSISRKFKPPCIVLSGPPCQRVKNIGKHLSTLLKAEHLTPETMVNFYLQHLGPKDVVQKKWSHWEKSVNEFTSLPRGKGLIKILNRVFLLPRVQKYGYVLEGFPDTYNEAQLLENILKIISEGDVQNFPEFNFDTNLLPDNYIVLLMNDKEMLCELDSKADDKGSKSAEMIKNLENFRSKLKEEHFGTEFYDERYMQPKLFYTEEFDSELNCAQSIHSMINKERTRDELIKGTSLSVTLPVLLDMMESKKDKYTLPENKTKVLSQISLSKLKIELDTNLKSNNENKNLNKGDEKKMVPTVETSDKNPQDKNISLQFPTADRNKAENIDRDQEKGRFEHGVFIDKAAKSLRGTEGNVSQCCIKNMKKGDSPADMRPSKISGNTGITKKKKNLEKEKLSCKQKVKNISVKDDISPIIDWAAVGNKVLKGTVTGWCKNKSNKQVSMTSMTSSSGKLKSNDSLSSPLNQNGDDGKRYSRTSECDEEDAESNPLDSLGKSYPGLTRTSPIFKNSDIDLYKNWYVFLDTKDGGDNALIVYKKESLMMETAFKECKVKQKSSKEIMTKNINKQELKAYEGVDRNQTIVKQGEEVQKLYTCCGKTELSDPHLKVCNYQYKDKFNNAFPGSEEVVNLTIDVVEEEHENFEDVESVKTLDLATEPLSKVNFLNTSSGSDTFVMAQLSREFEIPLESTSNIEAAASRRMSEMSNSGKSILKILSTHSNNKKSLTSISRKVRFSAGEDLWNIKTFEEKYSAWVESHLEELKSNRILKLHDPCMKYDGDKTCSVYLFKNLQLQMGSDWRNAYLNSLMDPFFHRMRLINYREIHRYFEKYWSHFRNNVPRLTLLPTSVMLQLERNYVAETVRVSQRKSLELLCDLEYEQTDPCVCNAQNYPAEDERDGSKTKLSRNSLRARSSLNIFKDSTEMKDQALFLPESTQQDRAIYIDCKKTSSWDSAQDLKNITLADETTIPFWNTSDSD